MKISKRITKKIEKLKYNAMQFFVKQRLKYLIRRVHVNEASEILTLLIQLPPVDRRDYTWKWMKAIAYIPSLDLKTTWFKIILNCSDDIIMSTTIDYCMAFFTKVTLTTDSTRSESIIMNTIELHDEPFYTVVKFFTNIRALSPNFIWTLVIYGHYSKFYTPSALWAGICMSLDEDLDEITKLILDLEDAGSEVFAELVNALYLTDRESAPAVLDSILEAFQPSAKKYKWLPMHEKGREMFLDAKRLEGTGNKDNIIPFDTNKKTIH